MMLSKKMSPKDFHHPHPWPEPELYLITCKISLAPVQGSRCPPCPLEAEPYVRQLSLISLAPLLPTQLH